MSQPGRRPFQRGARAVAPAAVLVVGAAALVAGCSGDDGAAPKPPASSSASPTAGPRLSSSLGTLTGRLPAAQRKAVAADVTKVVDGWLTAAYLGDYPRTDFSSAWPGFTAGARARAAHDAALTSNKDIGAKVDSVELTKRTVRLDVVSRHGRPVGVTARVIARFSTTGQVAEDVRVGGRLYLTKGPQGTWQVFGYDITKGTA